MFRSIEAIKQSLEKLDNEAVRINIIHGAVGAINETDVMLAATSNAIVIGFNVRPDKNAVKLAEPKKWIFASSGHLRRCWRY